MLILILPQQQQERAWNLLDTLEQVESHLSLVESGRKEVPLSSCLLPAHVVETWQGVSDSAHLKVRKSHGFSIHILPVVRTASGCRASSS